MRDGGKTFHGPPREAVGDVLSVGAGSSDGHGLPIETDSPREGAGSPVRGEAGLNGGDGKADGD